MDDEILGVEQAPGVAELETLKDQYRRTNKGLDAERELLEEAVREGRYADEQAFELGNQIEEAGRSRLDEIQRRIDAHCSKYGLRDHAFSATWSEEE
ncbi:hypothetical protein [Streptomyces sp. NPDC127103]|uniref:hypothetical protein n=1 Tax=Streptomyces sp. NPDC127103 TaxID=3347139 RepID=UPI0036495529